MKTKTPAWYQESKTSLQMIYLSFLGSICLLIIVGFILLPIEGGAPTMNNGAESMQMLLSVVGLGLCFGSMVFNQWALKPYRAKEAPLSGDIQGHIKITFIITWALAESCTIIGFYISYILNDPYELTLFATLSLLTILAHPFTEGRVRRALNR